MQRRISKLLDIAIREWSELPEIYETFFEMDSYDQMDFIAEWPKSEERLGQILQYADGAEMTTEQIVKFNKLYSIIIENTPIIENMKDHSGISGKLDWLGQMKQHKQMQQ